jgi:GNAT superfamily N-acetyltransferase
VPAPDGYEFSADPARVDLDALWAFLSTSAYWGRWRPREVVEAQVHASWRVVGCYDRDGAMIAFARAVSDGLAIAYLADVYVEAAHRGRGIGHALVEEIIERGAGARFRWLLHTADAHGLYRDFGFAEPGPAVMERPGGGRKGS